jgi:hypothetical protein
LILVERDPGPLQVLDELVERQRCTLQRTLKTEEGVQHLDRDAQLRYVNEQAKRHLAAGQPDRSVRNAQPSAPRSPSPFTKGEGFQDDSRGQT